MEKTQSYFYDVREMAPPDGAYCSCCRRPVESVTMFVYQKGSDMTTRNYLALCKDCKEAIKKEY